MHHHAPEPHPGFLPHLAADGLFDRFAGLDEPGQGAVPVGRPLFLAPEEDVRGGGGEDGHDDGGVRAREREVRYPGAGGAGGAGTGCGGVVGDGAGGGGGEEGEVCGRAGAFRAGVDGQGGVPALRAEWIAGVPVEEGARLGVDGGRGGGQRHVRAALDEGEVAGRG